MLKKKNFLLLLTGNKGIKKDKELGERKCNQAGKGEKTKKRVGWGAAKISGGHTVKTLLFYPCGYTISIAVTPSFYNCHLYNSYPLFTDVPFVSIFLHPKLSLLHPRNASTAVIFVFPFRIYICHLCIPLPTQFLFLNPHTPSPGVISVAPSSIFGFHLCIPFLVVISVSPLLHPLLSSLYPPYAIQLSPLYPSYSIPS